MSARGPVCHDLKCEQPFFADVRSGAKPFECRRADRDFRVGDMVRLLEYLPGADAFTGDMTARRITYVLSGERFGIMDGFCVLGLAT